MIRTFQTENIPVPSAPGLAPDFWKQSTPTDLEIGCGVGWHPITYASENPARRLIAIEHSKSRYQSFQRRWEKHGELENLLPVHANAIHWITHHVPERSIERLFTLFPNPYPKQSQRNKRWYAMAFTERLIGTLKPGGTWTLATNERFYIDEALETLGAHFLLSLVDRKAYSALDQMGQSPRTHFEKKYLLRGQTCYQLIFQRRDQISDQRRENGSC